MYHDCSQNCTIIGYGEISWKKYGNKTCKVIPHRCFPVSFNPYVYFVRRILSRVTQCVQLQHNDCILCNIEQLSCFPSWINLFICRWEIAMENSRDCRWKKPPEAYLCRLCTCTHVYSRGRWIFRHFRVYRASISHIHEPCLFLLSLLQQWQWIKSNASHAGVRLYLERGCTRKRERLLLGTESRCLHRYTISIVVLLSDNESYYSCVSIKMTYYSYTFASNDSVSN